MSPRTPSSPASADAASGPRRPAALMVLAGGLVAGSASFLPWVQSAWQAVDDEPAGATTLIPGRDLLFTIQSVVQTPRNFPTFSIDICFSVSLFWGVPFLLVALAAAALVTLPRAPTRGMRVSASILTVLAAGWVVLVTWYSLGAQHMEVITTTNTLQAGPIVALVGYACALAGLIVLAPPRSRPATTA